MFKNIPEEMRGYFTQIEDLRKNVKGIKDWWEINHKEDELFFLTGTPGKQAWKNLDIIEHITAKKKILNIGIGLGYCTKDLHNIGAEVHALDISLTALKRVEKYIKKGWTPDELPYLPVNYYDLAISHLVAQHMSDVDLLSQIKYVVNSLKKDGFFAIQIAFPLQEEYQFREDFETQKWGGVLRSIVHINELVKNAGAQIVWINKIGEFHDFGIGWYGIHIVKNNPTCVIEYHKQRLNKKLSKLIEGEAYYYQKNYDKALSFYNHALSIDSENLSSLKKYGETYYQKDEKLISLEMFNKAYYLNKIDLETILLMAQVYMELGEYLKACHLLIEYKNKQYELSAGLLITTRINVSNALNTLGDVYFASGLYTTAAKIYEKSLELYPGNDLITIKFNKVKNINDEPVDDTLLIINLAEMAIEEGRYDSARLILEDLLITEPKNISALIDIGVLNALEGNDEEAIKCFQQVIEYDPENEIALENLTILKK
jgi:tetratricopeptide (TPR) repeat protein